MLWQQSVMAYLPVAKPSLKTVKNLLVTSLTPYTLQFHGCLRSILKKKKKKLLVYFLTNKKKKKKKKKT